MRSRRAATMLRAGGASAMTSRRAATLARLVGMRPTTIPRCALGLPSAPSPSSTSLRAARAHGTSRRARATTISLTLQRPASFISLTARLGPARLSSSLREAEVRRRVLATRGMSVESRNLRVGCPAGKARQRPACARRSGDRPGVLSLTVEFHRVRCRAIGKAHRRWHRHWFVGSVFSRYKRLRVVMVICSEVVVVGRSRSGILWFVSPYMMSSPVGRVRK